MTLICPKCGKEISESTVNIAQDAAFCVPCGVIHKISVLIAQQTAVPTQATQIPEQQPYQAPQPEVPRYQEPQQTTPAHLVTPPQTAPQKAKFCMKCGSPLAEGVKFCAGCGAPTEAPPAQAVPGQSLSSQYSQYQQPQFTQPPPAQPYQNQQPYTPYSAPQYASPPAGAPKNPLQYIGEALNKYAVFQGRARRAEFWWFTLFNVIIYYLALFVGAKMGLIYWFDYTPINILATLVSLAFFLPSLAVCIRRMHDIGKSGWYILVPIYDIVLCATAGTTGPNQYGLDPKGE